jgi:hypothetical protein
MEENERRSSGKTKTTKSGCYMTNTEVEMLQEDKEEKKDNKKEKDMQKEEEGKEDEKNKKKTT